MRFRQGEVALESINPELQHNVIFARAVPLLPGPLSPRARVHLDLQTLYFFSLQSPSDPAPTFWLAVWTEKLHPRCGAWRRPFTIAVKAKGVAVPSGLGVRVEGAGVGAVSIGQWRGCAAWQHLEI